MLTFTENATVGQMHPVERKLIYDVIKQYKPEVCVECGTWMGGGSTFFIANALNENQKGKLHTWETDVNLFNYAVNFYADKPQLRQYIEFNNSDFLQGIKVFPKIDFALLDGPDWPDFTVDLFNYLNTVMPVGGNIVVHDWNVDKCLKLKPLLRSRTDWKILVEINDTSTGMCYFQKVS